LDIRPETIRKLQASLLLREEMRNSTRKEANQ